jgi:hypothetical protein
MLKSIQRQGRVTPAIGSGHLRRIRAAEDFSKPRARALHVRRSLSGRAFAGPNALQRGK